MQVLKSIETVCGPVPFEQLGWTLAHEHFFTVLVAVNIFQVCAPCVVVCVARV